jgi:hypothetical protein
MALMPLSAGSFSLYNKYFFKLKMALRYILDIFLNKTAILNTF